MVFLDLLYSSKVTEVCSFYNMLAPFCGVQFPWENIWKPKSPPKVSFFLWVASIGNILTAENLRKHNIVLVSWVLLV